MDIQLLAWTAAVFGGLSLGYAWGKTGWLYLRFRILGAALVVASGALAVVG